MLKSSILIPFQKGKITAHLRDFVEIDTLPEALYYGERRGS